MVLYTVNDAWTAFISFNRPPLELHNFDGCGFLIINLNFEMLQLEAFDHKNTLQLVGERRGTESIEYLFHSQVQYKAFFLLSNHQLGLTE